MASSILLIDQSITQVFFNAGSKHMLFLILILKRGPDTSQTQDPIQGAQTHKTCTRHGGGYIRGSIL